MSLTRATLRSRISGAIGLSNTDGSAEQALIDGWLDEAVEQFLLDTKCTVDTANLGLTAGEGDYTLPATVLAIKNIWIITADGTRVNLEPAPTGEILERRRFQTNGLFPTVFSLEGYDFLRIEPAAGSDSDTLYFDYIPAPADWSGATDTPSFVPSWGHPAIEEYAKWKAADWDDDTSSQIGERYQKGYDDMVKRAKMRINKMSGKWGPARPGGRSRMLNRIPTSPGVDLGN